MLAGRARRESTMMDVMVGLTRHWRRVSCPMKPVTPVRMTFIVTLAEFGRGRVCQYEVCLVDFASSRMDGD